MTMNNPKRIRRKRHAPKGSSRAKGDIVEQIVASMHDTLGVSIETNVYLPSLDGTGRTREIDVLISTQVAGYPVRVAIECKNESKPVGIEEIDEFIGKLQDVGLPLQHGVFVSASGYAGNAAIRAQKAGIKALILKDVTSTLPIQVREVFQSLIYLLATVTGISVRNNIGEGNTSDILFFRNESGELVGAIPDLIWQDWINGKIPSSLGKHNINITLPENWYQIVAGQVAIVHEVSATVKVSGHVISFSGRVQQHLLIDAVSQEAERFHLDSKFDPPSGRYPVQNFDSEEDLQNHLVHIGALRLSVGRFRIPRIILNNIFWPPSKSSFEKMAALVRNFEAGKAPDPHTISFSEIEGDDLSKAWEPIWDEHPAAKAAHPKKESG
jgi:type III secretion system FlhB-like substrate exporter